jgi:hypothetical protein
MLSPNF